MVIDSDPVTMLATNDSTFGRISSGSMLSATSTCSTIAFPAISLAAPAESLMNVLLVLVARFLNLFKSFNLVVETVNSTVNASTATYVLPFNVTNSEAIAETPLVFWICIDSSKTSAPAIVSVKLKTTLPSAMSKVNDSRMGFVSSPLNVFTCVASPSLIAVTAILLWSLTSS